MNKVETSDLLANMFRESRNRSGKSQEWVANKLGVSKKSVQNWESGMSTPNLITTFEWFNVIGIPMYPFFMSVLHPIEIADINKNTEEEKLRKALNVYIQEMPEHYIRELLYFCFGNHGSSPNGVLEILTAYLHLPLTMRISIAQSIATNYEICLAHNLVTNTDNVLPNSAAIEYFIDAGKKAALDGKDSYVN